MGRGMLGSPGAHSSAMRSHPPGSGRRLVGALEEGEQRRVGIGRSPDGIIGQEKLAERLAEERRLRGRVKSHAGAIRFSIRRIAAMEIKVSEVCTRRS